MADTTSSSLEDRIKRVEGHLERENPVLLDVVKTFRRLDDVAYKVGVLDRSESFATQVSWWPVISVLGTFSSGKSTFINRYIGQSLQPTGNQAVDDKFTVLCYGREATPRVLPGLALDSDPRFSFYQISRDIESATPGEGRRLDLYLQLKTCNSEELKGKILIDSPGFDADAQRTSTLRITDHIIDLSDLVLVFFDARHPEPGAMQDTLEHLVTNTLGRPDFNKFIYILNQIDNTAREDNPEEVFAAWQRALAQKGLTAGRFYRIYDPDVAMPIDDEVRRKRFETKREIDMKEILSRMHQVEVERAYRITGAVEKTAKAIRDNLMPRIAAARETWKRRVFWLDGIAFVLVLAALVVTFVLGYWNSETVAAWWESISANPVTLWTVVALLVVLAFSLHLFMRRIAARSVVSRLRRDPSLGERREWAVKAFAKNVRSWRPFFVERPVGWDSSARRKLDAVLAEADNIVQALNDRFATPSGKDETPAQTKKEERREEATVPANPALAPEGERESAHSAAANE